MAAPEVSQVDVAVVGAGLSGLTAARELRGHGASVTVLEARERVGGKMHTIEVGGVPVDLGAHWIGPTQRRMLALTDELGIATEKQHLDGRHQLTLGGSRHEFTGATPVVSVLGSAETALRVGWIELRRRLVDAEEPWRARGARRLDSITLAHWMRGLRSDTARATFTIAAQTMFGAEPSEISFLYFLWYAQCAGGLQALMDFEGGAQDTHLVGGTQQICERIAADLGAAVVLGSPVSSIAHGPEGVTVTSAQRTVRAEHVVVAVSPTVAGRIDFDPLLAPAREALAQRMPLGAYMKGVATYDRAWWRERGLSGLALSDTGPVQMVVDATPPEGRPGVLVGFITGAPAMEMTRLAGAERRAAVLGAIADALAPEALRPEGYLDFNWLEERWSRGCPVGLMSPGTMTRLGPALRAPCGAVHWGGTDTATDWTGYMEGAVQAGERVALEITA